MNEQQLYILQVNNFKFTWIKLASKKSSFFANETTQWLYHRNVHVVSIGFDSLVRNANIILKPSRKKLKKYFTNFIENFSWFA